MSSDFLLQHNGSESLLPSHAPQSTHNWGNAVGYFSSRQEAKRLMVDGAHVAAVAALRRAMALVDAADDESTTIELLREAQRANSEAMKASDISGAIFSPSSAQTTNLRLPCFNSLECGSSGGARDSIAAALRCNPAMAWLADSLDRSCAAGTSPVTPGAGGVGSGAVFPMYGDAGDLPRAVPRFEEQPPQHSSSSGGVGGGGGGGNGGPVHPFFQRFGKAPHGPDTSASQAGAPRAVPSTANSGGATRASHPGPPLPHPSAAGQPTNMGHFEYPSQQPGHQQVGNYQPRYAPPLQPPYQPHAQSRHGQPQPPQVDNSNIEACGQVTGFLTAAQQLEKDVKAGRIRNFTGGVPTTKKLGLGRQNFVPPLANRDEPSTAPGGVGPSNGAPAGNGSGGVGINKVLSSVVQGGSAPPNAKGANQQKGAGGADDDNDIGLIPPSLLNPDGTVPAKLEGLEPKLVAQVALEILETSCSVGWEDISGLDHAKASVEEAIVWPLKRPDLFVGLRDPPKGLLLFGPPGTGKTMIARAIASRANCTFMNISSSSLMSKWVGEGEKLVRCMFAVANVKQPSVIFIDEIDSLLSMRSEGEMDAVRRVKTEFLVQLDGVGTSGSDRVLVIGATNRPEELDEAARRRMEKRLYIPLPDYSARRHLLSHVVRDMTHTLSDRDFEQLATATDGYSCADLKILARDAAMGPLREAMRGGISSVSADNIRPISIADFRGALKRVKTSVGKGELERHEKWNREYGSFSDEKPEDDAMDENDDPGNPLGGTPFSWAPAQ